MLGSESKDHLLTKVQFHCVQRLMLELLPVMVYDLRLTIIHWLSMEDNHTDDDRDQSHDIAIAWIQPIGGGNYQSDKQFFHASILFLRKRYKALTICCTRDARKYEKRIITEQRGGSPPLQLKSSKTSFP